MITITESILSDTKLNPISKLVYGVIAQEIANSPTNSCRISHETIGARTGVGRASAKAATEQLYDEGLIDRSKDSKGWLSYTLKG